jgi:RNA polymerase sigma factor (sigma-70 family)
MVAVVPLDQLPDTDLVTMARAGNRAAVDTLILRHEGLIRAIVKRLNPAPGIDRDDLIQAGRLAITVVSKYDGFDPALGKFSTYAYGCIWRAVLDESKRQAKYLAGPITEPEFVPERVQDVPDVGEYLAPLAPIERAFITEYFGFSGRVKTERGNPRAGRDGIVQAGRKFGLSRGQAQEFLARTMTKLQDYAGVPARAETRPG